MILQVGGAPAHVGLRIADPLGKGLDDAVAGLAMGDSRRERRVAVGIDDDLGRAAAGFQLAAQRSTWAEGMPSSLPP
jgi:hypothetical protein